MKVLRIPNRYALISGLTFFAAVSCARKPDPSLDPMLAAPMCDTTLMRPFGRAVEIPEMPRRTDFAGLTGVVLQDETGDAIEGAVVDLRVLDRVPDSARIFRYTNSKGGFSFDSLKPGTYRLRARRVGESVGIDTIHPRAGRVDTLSVRMRAYRCYGY